MALQGYDDDPITPETGKNVGAVDLNGLNKKLEQEMLSSDVWAALSTFRQSEAEIGFILGHEIKKVVDGDEKRLENERMCAKDAHTRGPTDDAELVKIVYENIKRYQGSPLESPWGQAFTALENKQAARIKRLAVADDELCGCLRKLSGYRARLAVSDLAQQYSPDPTDHQALQLLKLKYKQKEADEWIKKLEGMAA